MTWVTKLGPEAGQVEYRLAEAAGCTAGLDSGPQPAAGDAQLRYHLDGSDHGLTWFGEGLRDVGLAPGTAMTEAGKDAARALMAGVDPRTGAVLRAPKMELDPRGKLAAAPLAEAMAKAAADRGAGGAQDLVAGNAWAAARLARISRGLDRQGEAHKVPAGDLRKVAAAAGLGLDGVYGAAAVAEAERFAGRHVRTGNRGYDLELDLPKSVSVLWALADPATAAGVERIYRSAVADTLAAVGQWCAYGERGHQGDGQRAERVASSGLLGWVMWHSTARPAGRAATRPAPARPRGHCQPGPV